MPQRLLIVASLIPDDASWSQMINELETSDATSLPRAVLVVSSNKQAIFASKTPLCLYLSFL